MKTRILIVLLVFLSMTVMPMGTSAAPPEKSWSAEYALEIQHSLAEGEHSLLFVWEWSTPDPGSVEIEQSLIIDNGAPLYRGNTLIGPFWVYADVNPSGKHECDYVQRPPQGEWMTPTLHSDQDFTYFVRLVTMGDRGIFNEDVDGTTFTIYIDGILYGTMKHLRTYSTHHPNSRTSIENRMCSLTHQH